MATQCTNWKFKFTLKNIYVLILVNVTILLATTYLVDLNEWTKLKPGLESKEDRLQKHYFRHDEDVAKCRNDKNQANLWGQRITIEAVKLFSSLKTGLQKISFGLSPIHINKPGHSHVSSNMTAIRTMLYEANVCVFINQSGSGFAKIMTEINFKGAQCSNKNPSFSNNNRYRTALVSFERSGNSWTRHLLEYISGIHTGSVYNDTRLRGVFKAEGHIDRVVAIKTHQAYEVAKKHAYDNVILLVRRPEDSILSYFNFIRTGSHLGNVKQELYQKKAWQLDIRKGINRWKNFYLRWLENYKGRMFLLSYTRLTRDFYNEVHKLAEFLNVTMTYKTLWCAHENKEGNFHRHSNVHKGEVYTKKTLNNIMKTRKKIEQKIVRVFGDAANGVF